MSKKMSNFFFLQDGQTPLHIACLEGHHEVVKLLLRNSELGAKDKRVWKPKILLKRGFYLLAFFGCLCCFP